MLGCRLANNILPPGRREGLQIIFQQDSIVASIQGKKLVGYSNWWPTPAESSDCNPTDLICGTIFDYVIHFRMAKVHKRPYATVCKAVSEEA